MKKLLLFVFLSILIFVPSQVFAAPLEIHGDITKSLSLEDFDDNTDILDTLISGKYSLEISLSGNNDTLFKAGIKNIGSDLNLDYTRRQSYYIDFSSPAFSLWFAMGANDNYPVFNLGDHMGAGNLSERFRLAYGEASWKDDYKYDTLYWYDYYNTTGIVPKFQVGTNLNVGKFNFIASYGQYYVANPYWPLLSVALSDPLSAGILSEESLGYFTNIMSALMLRGKLNLNEYLNLGLSFINFNLEDDCGGCPGEGYSNLILDLTGKTPYIGGNYTLALLATAVQNSCGSSETSSLFADGGFGIYAALQDIPIGKLHQFKLGLDIAAFPSSSSCNSFTYNDDNLMHLYLTSAVPTTNFMYNTLRAGVNLSTTVDLEEFGYIDLTLRNYYAMAYEDNIPSYSTFSYNTLSLESDLNTPNGSRVNLIVALTSDLTSGLMYSETEIFMGLKASVVVTENLTINSKIWLDKQSTQLSYAAQIGALGKWDLPTNDYVKSADYTLGGMFGFFNVDSQNLNTLSTQALGYTELNTKFTNNLGLHLAAYVDNNFFLYPIPYYYDYNYYYVNYSATKERTSKNDKLFNFIATATGEYWFTDKLVLSATATYRNWDINARAISYEENSSGIIGENYPTEHTFTVVDNFFTMIALTYNFSNNSSIQLAWGKSGLADAEVTNPAKYPNATVYPWMKLSTAPRYGEMDWKALKLTVSIKF